MSTDSDVTPRLPLQAHVWLVALVGSVFMWLAQPPVAWSWLAWVAPLPWLSLATRPQPAGRSFYLKLWLAGFAYWMMAIHWIRLAHPATIIGLFFLAGYLGVYVPLFVAVVRQGVHRLRSPLWVVAPVAWVATEWLQGHLLGGFLMGNLGHTQINHPHLVQIADLGGAYLVSGLVMLVASCLWQAMQFPPLAKELEQLSLQSAVTDDQRPSSLGAFIAAAVAVVAVVGTYWYGDERLEQLKPPADAMHKELALIQGSERAVWTSDPGRDQRVMDLYHDLSLRAMSEANQQDMSLDLIVWPEGMFRVPIFSYDPAIPGADTRKESDYAKDYLTLLHQLVDTPLLVGLDRVHFVNEEGVPLIYNAAVAVDRQGQILGTYDKTHLVMFGEYVPGGTILPAIYQMFPIGGLTPGERPAAFAIEGVRYMPTICYETVIPHVVRQQVRELTDAEQQPDVLVNITNDSWFYDSSELAMHLTCTRLRAIECRTPVVVAANGGLSANIDNCGRVLAVSQPMIEEVLLVDVVPGGQPTLYLQYGDTFAIACLVGTVLVLLTRIPFVPFRHARRSHASRCP